MREAGRSCEIDPLPLVYCAGSLLIHAFLECAFYQKAFMRDQTLAFIGIGHANDIVADLNPALAAIRCGRSRVAG